MTDTYSLEDKISNIRNAIRNLTGDTYEKEYQYLSKSDIENKKLDPKSLEVYLEARYEDEQSKVYTRSPFDNQTKYNFDYSRDDRNISRTSFQGPHSNKIITSFTSEEIKDMSSFKFNEGKENSELGLLLEHEKENVKKLEQRIVKKDEIITSMNIRQASLTEEIAQLKKNSCYAQNEEYKSIISSLQEKLEKYSTQITFLQSQVQRNSSTPDFKKSQTDELHNRISLLERQNTELIANNNELSSFTSRWKQDQALITDLRYQLENKDKQITELVQENKELAYRLNDIINTKKDSRQEFREFKLKEEITRLKQINTDLTEKATRYTPRDIEKDRPKSRKRSCSSNKVTEKATRYTPRDIEKDRPKSRKRSCSSNKVITDITNCLQCTSSEIIFKIHKLRRCEKLQKRLEQLLKDLSPNNTVLNTKQIWKCIRKIIEEYLVIKKKLEGGDLLYKIAELLGVSEADSYEEVMKICEEKKMVNALMAKIKKMLCLSPHAALREVEDTIDEKV
ncbi:hypothetical protein SteCoe_4184 [Stentor coeruleus]|uniref:Uncharacterized protein n=1 Tax=Stentor coeruleus TaxID=5963 RepID=A0A1R2CVG0_9CILI|nr:hypothetical protein SteCoe_4184 [Stentor coeruleus]